MIVPHEHPVTPEWRAKTLFRMAEMGLSVGVLARGISAGVRDHWGEATPAQIRTAIRELVREGQLCRDIDGYRAGGER